MSGLMMPDLLLPCAKKIFMQEHCAHYMIAPLERGYGTLLGNALRRVLLSSLPGAAVTSIQIVGARHEFQDISDVLEDVTEIVLNVKRLRVRCFSDHPVSMRLTVSGACEVTAADILAPSTVEIVNPDQHLATLDNENARLEMELIVETGRGYVRARSKEDQPIGVIPVDALYSPIQKVNYKVEQIPASHGETLLFEITTDGSLTPDEALRYGAEILVQQCSVFSTYHLPLPASDMVGIPIPQEIYTIPLDDLDLSLRVYNRLKRRSIHVVGQVLTMDDEDLLSIRHFAEKSLQEVYDRLKERGLLPVSEEEFKRLKGSELSPQSDHHSVTDEEMA